MGNVVVFSRNSQEIDLLFCCQKSERGRRRGESDEPYLPPSYNTNTDTDTHVTVNSSCPWYG